MNIKVPITSKTFITLPKLPNKSVSFIIAGLVSLFTSNFTMNKLILFLNSTSFEIQDKIFYNDIGYYLFQKPFLEYIVWFILITIIALTVYAGAYYIIALNTQFDGVRSETLKKSKISKQLLNNVKIVAVLIAVITFLKTQDLSSTKFLTIGDTTTYSLYGAGLADVSIKLWGYRLLSVVIVISAFFPEWKLKSLDKSILQTTFVSIRRTYSCFEFAINSIILLRVSILSALSLAPGVNGGSI